MADGEESTTIAKNLLILPHLEKLPQPPVDSLSTKLFFPAITKSHTPTKQQFLRYNPIERAFLAVFIAPALCLIKSTYSLDTQVILTLILTDVPYSQKAVLNFENGWSHQDH